MDPVFLNFRDNGLEKEYRNSLLTKAMHTGDRKQRFRVLTRLAVLAREKYRLETPTSMVVKLTLLAFVVMPLVENAIRKRMPRAMFYEYWENVAMMLGLLNVSFLTLAMGQRLLDESHPLVPPQFIDAAAFKIFILCSGVLLHIFNVWWYTLRFKNFLKLATYTFAITALSQASLACEKILVRSTLIATLRDASCLLNLASQSTFLPAPSLGRAVECGASDADACRQTLVFTNLWVGVLGSLGWIWFSERKSRGWFLENLNAGVEHRGRIPVIAERCWWEGAILFLLVCPLAWAFVSFINGQW
ncbi:hypothetical protein BSKO_05888 [Bryopsis sp. KO-2023]|nr:hypothetical protein BSKO_05888 [Bryopsis sp. KO-2023]